jgi:hypothetical protein
MISKGDVELSVISKNFFFTYFNFFIVFTALGTVSMSFDNWGDQNIRETAGQLAQSIQELRRFYINYIILQAGPYSSGLSDFTLLRPREVRCCMPSESKMTDQLQKRKRRDSRSILALGSRCRQRCSSS